MIVPEKTVDEVDTSVVFVIELVANAKDIKIYFSARKLNAVMVPKIGAVDVEISVAFVAGLVSDE